MQQSSRPSDPAKLSQAMRLLDVLAAKTGIYRMGCNMEPEAAETAYRGMQ